MLQACFLFLTMATGLQEPSPSFHHQIRPILQAHCQGCHQPAKSKGGLDLSDYDALMEGASGEAVVMPGNAASSLLMAVVLPFEQEAPAMPPDGPALAAEETELLRRWIQAGAKDDTPSSLKRTFDQENPPSYEQAPVLTGLDYSPDGRWLAVSGYHEVLVHDAAGGGMQARWIGLSERIQSLAFSPDGRYLAVTGGSPARFGEIQIWQVESGRLLWSQLIGHDTLFGGSWSPDSKWFAFGCPDNSVRVLEVPSGEAVLFQGAHNDWVLGTAFSSDASHLVSISRDRSMKLYKVETDQFIDNITSITPGALKGGLMAVARHPGRDQLLVGGADGTPRLYKMYREKKRVIGDDFNLIRAYQALPGRIYAVVWEPGGSWLAAASSAGGKGFLAKYQVDTEQAVWTAEVEAPVYDLAIQPVRQHLTAACADGRLRIYHREQGKMIESFLPTPKPQSPSRY
ncbi:MAG: hypothetical protein DWQ01_12840 [Planctomycetota bacterium]|nr:MAG: hypothetical protein DWQ01_12840 [Planctomycetota bacterium]